MSRLVILKEPDPENRHSPELRYLMELDRLAAEEAFHSVSLFDDGTVPNPGGLRDRDQVLVIHRDPVLLLRGSLHSMARAISENGGVAVPFRLSDCRPPGWDRIFTRREFEDVETAFLRSPPPDKTPVSTRPVALFEAAAFRRFLEYNDNEPWVECSSERLEGVRFVGLQHTFVDYYGEVRRDILPFLPREARTILDVGCGRGTTGAWLREELGCRVTGVELNPEVAADAATRLDQVVTGDIASIELRERFDAVLALELFEHLTEPVPVLRKLGRHLVPGGRIVLSVPNVGHYSIVRDLLAGRWDYVPIGLLCYTHYRFFTRHTLEEWIRAAGFRRFEIVPQRTPVPEEMLALTSLAVDRDSLATKGFYVSIEAPDLQAPEATQ